MQAGLVVLCLAYVLSQFFRAFLAVLTTDLGRDIGATPEDLAFASGLWFLLFAAMQIPVGWALDRVGPRRSSALLLLIGGAGGAGLFAVATTPFHVALAMALIGVGCSPVLMASYYIFAREFPPAKFATLAAVMLGVGSVGNLVASYPTALAVELMGWRATLAGLAIISGVVAAGIWLSVHDPKRVETEQKGSVLDLLKEPALWAILPLMLVAYAPSAALRGLWAGPYFRDVFNLSTAQIGQATLIMGAAMIAGTFAYGPLDRIFKTRKWVIFGGNALGAVALVLLCLWIDAGVWLSILLLAVIGFLGASFPGHHGPWARLHSGASSWARRYVVEPVWHRRRWSGTICHRTHPCGQRRDWPHRALYRDLRLFRRHPCHWLRDLSIQSGQRGLKHPEAARAGH